MRGSPPLRFLALVLGGWAALRTALIAPPWPAPGAGAAVPAAKAHARPAPRPEARPGPAATVRALERDRLLFAAAPEPAYRPTGRGPGRIAIRPLPASRAVTRTRQATMAPALSLPAPRALAAARPERPSAPAGRWSLSAWSFVRRDGSAPLAAGGLLGGSQAGARLAYRLNRDSARPLALSLRLSAALQRAPAAEAALGLDWRPDRRLPVHLLAERRQALSREGRSAFSVAVHGGVSDAPLGPFRLDAYGQAGLVGVRSRDAFGDGALRLSLPLTRRVRLGAGAWAAAQPGASRVDLGPQAAIRLPVAGRALTLAADWRLRVAGNARPGSGPTLTLATDF